MTAPAASPASESPQDGATVEKRPERTRLRSSICVSIALLLLPALSAVGSHMAMRAYRFHGLNWALPALTDLMIRHWLAWLLCLGLLGGLWLVVCGRLGRKTATIVNWAIVAGLTVFVSAWAAAAFLPFMGGVKHLGD